MSNDNIDLETDLETMIHIECPFKSKLFPTFEKNKKKVGLKRVQIYFRPQRTLGYSETDDFDTAMGNTDQVFVSMKLVDTDDVGSNKQDDGDDPIEDESSTYGEDSSDEDSSSEHSSSEHSDSYTGAKKKYNKKNKDADYVEQGSLKGIKKRGRPALRSRSKIVGNEKVDGLNAIKNTNTNTNTNTNSNSNSNSNSSISNTSSSNTGSIRGRRRRRLKKENVDGFDELDGPAEIAPDVLKKLFIKHTVVKTSEELRKEAFALGHGSAVSISNGTKGGEDQEIVKDIVQKEQEQGQEKQVGDSVDKSEEGGNSLFASAGYKANQMGLGLDERTANNDSDIETKSNSISSSSGGSGGSGGNDGYGIVGIEQYTPTMVQDMHQSKKGRKMRKNYVLPPEPAPGSRQYDVELKKWNAAKLYLLNPETTSLREVCKQNNISVPTLITYMDATRVARSLITGKYCGSLVIRDSTLNNRGKNKVSKETREKHLKMAWEKLDEAKKLTPMTSSGSTEVPTPSTTPQ